MKTRKAASSDIESLKNIDSLPHRREIQVSYRGISSSVQVGSVAEEVLIRSASGWKTCAASCKELPSLFAEDSLADQSVQGEPGKVGESVLRQSRIARDRAAKMMAIDVATDGETVKAFRDTCYLTLTPLCVLFSFSGVV